MKTKNNVQKAIFKSLIVVIGMVLISSTINAQDIWKEIMEHNNLNNQLVAMVETNSRLAQTSSNAYSLAISNAFASYSEMESETSMELEDWMVNDVYFASSFEMTEETEIPLELENWMTNSNYFSTDSFITKTETEQTLELEGWMVDAETWK